MKKDKLNELIERFPHFRKELRALNQFTGKGMVREIMHYILGYRGYLYATDARTAIRVKGELDKEHKKFLEKVYPGYARTFTGSLSSYFAEGRKAPKIFELTFNREFKKEVKLRAEKAIKELQEDDYLKVRIGTEYYNWRYVEKALNVLRGPVTVRELKLRNCVILSNGKYEILIMKIMNHSWDPISSISTIDLRN